MPHNHAHHAHAEGLSDRKLYAAVGVNMLLTVVQVAGGVMSGSLSLIADAIHNLSDAVSLVIALAARIVGRKPRDRQRTFGYKRMEIVATLVNLTTLVVIGLYLVYEAIMRFFQPEEIAGWIVVIIAAVALVVDVVTALLTYKLSKKSMNIRAAFLHNVSDALGSVGVMIAGSLILIYQWYWVDALVTLLIAGYVLWQGFAMLPKTIHILIEGVPESIKLGEVIETMNENTHVQGVHHVHIWQLDETSFLLEAHVVIDSSDQELIHQTKTSLKKILKEKFNIDHSTLEIELSGQCAKQCL